ncbi:M56 family metallopeptidase [Oscillospiraceae bacterium PP1C4]
MNELFLRIVNMSLAATVIGLAIFLFRAIGKHRLPRWVFYTAWGLVLVRLLLPVSVPSPVSAFNAIPYARPQQSFSDGALAFVEDSGTAVDFPTLQTRPAGTDTPDAVSDVSAAPQQPAPHPAAVVAPARIDVTTILSTIWLSGMIMLLAYSAICYCYTLYRIKTADRLEHMPELDAIFAKAGINPAHVALYRSGLFESPVVCGLMRPRLVLSGLVNAADTAHVMAHELTHICRRDNLWKALATLALYLHWFNPLMWLCYHFYVIDMEVSCDEAVICEGFDRKEYAYSLVGMATKSRSAFAGGFLAFGESALKERVKSIMQIKKNTAIISIICISVLAGLVIVFLTDPQSKPSVHTMLDSLSAETLDHIVIDLPDGETVNLPQEKFEQAVSSVTGLKLLPREPIEDQEIEMAFSIAFGRINDDTLVLEYYPSDEKKDWITVWKDFKSEPESFWVDSENAAQLKNLMSKIAFDENGNKAEIMDDEPQSTDAPTSIAVEESMPVSQSATVPVQSAPMPTPTQLNPLSEARAALDGLNLQELEGIFVGRDAPNSQIAHGVEQSYWKTLVLLAADVEFSEAKERYVSSEPQYQLMFRKRNGRNLHVEFNTGSITVSEESSGPVQQQYYSYSFMPKTESMAALAKHCEKIINKTGEPDRYRWEANTVIRESNPDYLKIPYDQVDCVNLIDRESRTYMRLDPTLAKRVVLAINMIYPIESNAQPVNEGLRMLQIRYKNGDKAEYWMHSNVFMYGDVKLGGIDRNWKTGMADLYYYLDLPTSEQMRSGEMGTLGAEWLGFMNPYRITEMRILRDESRSEQVFTTAAGDARRNDILKIAKALQGLKVNPGFTKSFTKSQFIREGWEDELHDRIDLVFENGKEHYTIRFFHAPGRVSIETKNIDYILSYYTQSSSYEQVIEMIRLIENDTEMH